MFAGVWGVRRKTYKTTQAVFFYWTDSFCIPLSWNPVYAFHHVTQELAYIRLCQWTIASHPFSIS